MNGTIESLDAHFNGLYSFYNNDNVGLIFLEDFYNFVAKLLQKFNP